MKIAADIPDSILQENIKRSHTGTKEEAVLIALKEYNRLQNVKELVAMFGSSSTALSNNEIEALED